MRRSIARLGLLIVPFFLLACLLCTLVFSCRAFGANSHNNPALENQLWWGDATPPYVVSGCLPSLPASSITLAPFACEAYVGGTQGELVYVTQSAAGLTLTTTAGTNWLAVCRDNSSTVSGWTRQAGTHYISRLSATRPADPAGCQVVAQVTVASSVVSGVRDYRRPRSLTMRGVYDITDPLYGAIGDNATDNKAAIEAALRAANEGGTVFVPRGIFLVGSPVTSVLSNTTLEGTGSASVIKARTGFTAAGNLGLITFGYDLVSGVEVPVTNITVQHLRLDGSNLAKALQFAKCTQCRVLYIDALNGGPSHASLYTTDTVDLLIEGNYVGGSVGLFGDGIYAGGAVRPRIINNTVNSFTRIGIVTEAGNAGAKSLDVYIAGNTIRHAHDATGTEYNAGIWCENTCGVTLHGNVIEDMVNTPGPNPPQGIVASIGSAGRCKWFITSNHISGAERGLWLATDGNDSVHVRDLTVQRGTLTNYKYGIEVSRGYDILIEGLTLGINDFLAATGSGVIVDLAGSPVMNSLTITNSYVNQESSASIYGPNNTTLNIYGVGAGLNNLTLHNLRGWYILMGAAPTVVTASDSELLYREDSTFSNAFAVQGYNVYISNSRMIRHTGAGSNERVFRPLDYSTYRFTHVTFVDFKQFWDANNTGLVQIFFESCEFLSSIQQSFGMFGSVYVNNSIFWENTGWGAFRTNQRNLEFHLKIRNSHFINSNLTLTPITQGTYAPTTAELWNNTWTTTLLTNMPGASVVSPQGVPFTGLGTRGNGSQLYCYDCTIANPCAAGGTGAMAKRLNGVWVCN